MKNEHHAPHNCSRVLLAVSCIHYGSRSGTGRTEPPNGSTRRVCDHPVRLLPSILCPRASGRRGSAGRWAYHPTCGWNSKNVRACEYPRYTASGEIVTAGAAESGPRRSATAILNAAGATTSTSYGELTATWTVPPAPTSNDGQIVFFFPALDDIDDVVSILQPVLGWNSDFAGAWSIASWNCCPNGITGESPAVSVSPGDEIQGTIRDTCSAGTVSCPTWNVTTEDVSTGQSTTLSRRPVKGRRSIGRSPARWRSITLSNVAIIPRMASLSQMWRCMTTTSTRSQIRVGQLPMRPRASRRNAATVVKSRRRR